MSIYVCPRMATYAAYDGAVFYPPNHPFHPRLSVRPARCFAAPEDAEVAGYSLAQAPPGVQVAEGVYLAPTDEVLARRCKDAANRLGFPVPCPSVLPTPVLGTGPPRCEMPYSTKWPCVYGGFVLSQQSFDVPPGYSELQSVTHGPHLVVAAFPSDGTAMLLKDRSSAFYCPGAYSQGRLQIVGETFVAGIQAIYLECGEGSGDFSGYLDFEVGHVVLQWSREGVTYQVSLHGHTGVNRRLAQYIANVIDYVSPT